MFNLTGGVVIPESVFRFEQEPMKLIRKIREKVFIDIISEIYPE
jgi:hypothetical protein